MTKILRKRQVTERTGLPPSSMYEKISAGTFPKPIRLGGEGTRCTGWIESEVEAWIQERIEASRNQSKAKAG